MKLPSPLSLILFLLVAEYSRACAHHEEDHRILVPSESDTEFEFPGCGMEATSPDQRLEEAKIMRTWKAVHFDRDLGPTNYEIPVYFHVLRDNDGNGDVSDSMLAEYMTDLNDAYASTPFTFRLVQIGRIDNTDWHLCSYANNREVKTKYNLGGVGSLNVYFCDIQVSVGGWSYMPYQAGTEYDGVVVESNYAKYGFPDFYVRRVNLPHETGHWLGLYHTFQDGCDATYETNDNWFPEYAYYNGDGVLDTPAHIEGKTNCKKTYNTCPDNIPGVDPGNDPLDNIMAKAKDSCGENFTPGQIERMVALYEHYRLVVDQNASAVTPNNGETVSTLAPNGIQSLAPTTSGSQSPNTGTRGRSSSTNGHVCRRSSLCAGSTEILFGFTKLIHNTAGATCETQCVSPATARQWIQEGTFACGPCPSTP